MREIVSPARAIHGIVTIPGDKSISHRYGMLASIAEGRSTLTNYSTGADCQSTLACMAALGAKIERQNGTIVIDGGALREPAEQLDAGNSGSTIRMLSGILAAQPFTSRIGGDESLSRRPMGRIIAPLTEMGGFIEAQNSKFPPLTIHGRPLHGIDYSLPMASAQVKSCVLLAGLFAQGDTIVREPVRTRDHTEIALKEFGADIETVIHGVGLNPTRSGLLDFLASMGAKIKVLEVHQVGGELIGDLRVESSAVTGGVIEGALTAALIDEIPALAVLGAASQGGLTVRDAGELRVKETDRIATIEAGFRKMGVEIETGPEGFHVPGRQKFHAAEVDSAGDHRIAMAFAVAALAADGPCTIEGSESAGVSFPEFFATLQQIIQQ